MINTSGLISGPSVITGLSNLTSGASYYLSKTNAGDWTTQVPLTGEWNVSLGLALDTETFLFAPGQIAIQDEFSSMWVDIGTAGQTLSFSDVVYLDIIDATYKKASSNGNSRQARADGIVLGNAAQAAQVRVLLLGKFTNATWNWVPGSLVYLIATQGQVATNPPITGYNTTIGRVIGTNTIWFNPSLPQLIG